LQLRRGPGPNRPTNNVLTRTGKKGPWHRYGYNQNIQYDLYKRCKITDGPSINDLTRYRYYGPGLSADAEADIILQAQAGDKRAGFRLVQAFHRFILKRAGSRNKSWFNYNNFDDLMGTSALAFWEGVSTWKPEDGHALATNCYLRVHGAVADARKRFRKRGIAGETLLQRIAFKGHTTETEQRKLQKRYSSFSELAAALEEAAEQVNCWTEPVSYSTTEEDDAAPLYASDDADFEPVRWSKHSSRKRDRIDELALDADRHAARRLKQIGRRAYALELVEKQNQQLKQTSRLGYPDFGQVPSYAPKDRPG
jgi:DNA-directed RNA polymerase specialized sigma subunit